MGEKLDRYLSLESSVSETLVIQSKVRQSLRHFTKQQEYTLIIYSIPQALNCGRRRRRIQRKASICRLKLKLHKYATLPSLSTLLHYFKMLTLCTCFGSTNTKKKKKKNAYPLVIPLHTTAVIYVFSQLFDTGSN